MGWVTRTYTFTASSSATTIKFESTCSTCGAFGPAIDCVCIPNPFPTTTTTTAAPTTTTTTTTTTIRPQIIGNCSSRSSFSRIQLRRGTDAQFSSFNTVLASGEPGYATDTRVIKVGDGYTPWSSLSSIQHNVNDIIDITSLYRTNILTIYPDSNRYLYISWAKDKQIQRVSLNGNPINIIKSNGWPGYSDNYSVDVLLEISITNSATSVDWTGMVNGWYTQPPQPMPIGTHLVLLRAMGNSIDGHYKGSKYSLPTTTTVAPTTTTTTTTTTVAPTTTTTTTTVAPTTTTTTTTAAPTTTTTTGAPISGLSIGQVFLSNIHTDLVVDNEFDNIRIGQTFLSNIHIDAVAEDEFDNVRIGQTFLSNIYSDPI